MNSSAERTAPPPPLQPCARAHVLIVIDHIWLRSVIVDLLLLCVRGLVVHEAGNRADALALARDVPATAIVVDAGLNGAEVPRLIEELGAAAPRAQLIVLADQPAALPEYAALAHCVAIRKDDAARQLPGLIVQAIGTHPPAP